MEQTELTSQANAADPATQRSRAATQAIVEDLRAKGLLYVTVPEASGGQGGSLGDAVRAVIDCAAQSGSAGLTFAMHLSQLYTLQRHSAGSAYLTQCLQELASEAALFASVASEVHTRGNIHASHSQIERTAEGAMARKTSSNTSYATEAGAFLVTSIDSSGKRPVQKLVLVRARDTVLTARHRNELLGMRGIDNRSWQFDFRFPEAGIFSGPFSTIASQTMTPATHILWAAVWSGIAETALAKARTFLTKECDPAAPETAVGLTTLSTLCNGHFTLNALIRDALAALSERQGKATSFVDAARINRLKIIGSDLAVEIVLGTLRICGLRGYAESGPYTQAEAVRDVLSGPLMVSNARLQSNTLGIERFVIERP